MFDATTVNVAGTEHNEVFATKSAVISRAVFKRDLPAPLLVGIVGGQEEIEVEPGRVRGSDRPRREPSSPRLLLRCHHRSREGRDRRDVEAERCQDPNLGIEGCVDAATIYIGIGGTRRRPTRPSGSATSPMS